MSEIKSVNIPVAKFSVAKAIELIQTHASGRVLQGAFFNPTSLTGGTLEIHTSPVPSLVQHGGPSATDLLAASRKERTGKTSIYTGVFWDKQTQKWRTQIDVNGERKMLRFNTEEEAARQYDAWVRKYRPSQTVPNFPNHIERSPEANEIIDNIIQKLSDSNEGA